MMEKKVSKFVELFDGLPDQRQEWKIKHKLTDILFIAVVATIADCDGWEEIEWFAHEKEPWFRQYLELPCGIPSHDTMERVFTWLDPEAFRARFLQWVGLSDTPQKKGVIAIDGKTMRGSGCRSKLPLHVVNAWFSGTGMILGQEYTQEKSNEITAIPELLDILDIAGHIVTTDAMGAQRDIAEKIIKKKGDYVLAVKGNQPGLLEDIGLFFARETEGIKTCVQRNTGHGRIERRTCSVCDDIKWLDPEEKWSGLKSIGMTKNWTEDKATGKACEETRYYISSLPADAERFAYAVRQHWGVESMHWSLDTTFNEDGRRGHKDNAAKNLAQLLRLAYDILKSMPAQGKKMPLKRMRKKAMLDEKYLEDLVSSVF